jgi:hypothetical protein
MIQHPELPPLGPDVDTEGNPICGVCGGPRHTDKVKVPIPESLVRPKGLGSIRFVQACSLECLVRWSGKTDLMSESAQAHLMAEGVPIRPPPRGGN